MSNDDRDELSIEIGTLSAEEQEEMARRFPPCTAKAAIDTADWRVHDAPRSIRLKLPAVYQLAEEHDDHLMLWRAPDDSIVLLTLHDGSGREMTTIAPPGPMHGFAHEPLCRVRSAGRDALVFLGSYTLDGTRHYTGRLDVGVRAGLGFGLAFLSPDPRRGPELLRIAETVEVAD